MKTSIGGWIGCSACVLLGAMFGAAHADDQAGSDRGPIANDIEVSLGIFLVSNDTKVRLDGTTGRTGTYVDWEDELGLDDEDRLRVDAFWRFAKRHKVRLMYFSNDRSATRSNTRQIEFGDTTFPINTSISAQLDTTIIELAYEYAFYQSSDWEVSGSFGIHDVDISASLTGTITSGLGGGSVQATEEGSANGPLPVLGVHALWHMGGNFYLDGLTQYFYVQVDNFDGRLSDYKLSVSWYPMRHLGVGLGFNRFVTKVDVDKAAFTGSLRTSYGGPMLFLTGSF